MLNGVSLQVNFRSDANGCGYYRMKFVNDTIPTDIRKKARFMDCESPFRDETFLKYTDAVRLQRLYSPVYKGYFEWLKEMSVKYRFPIIVDYDDILVFDDIPLWNHCRNSSFQCDDYIDFYLNGADIITVPNVIMRDYYSTKFNISISKFKVINNYIPKWWMGQSYSKERSKYMYNKYKKRIVFCCSTSHFDVGNLNNGIDDFTDIVPWIIDNLDKYDFCFQGGVPLQLAPYKDKITSYIGVPFLYYPMGRINIGATLYVQPLQKCIFNEAKSTIKQQEAWVEGIPILTQNTKNYMAMDSEMCFSSPTDLDNKVSDILSDENTYMSIVESRRNKANMYWLEDNLIKWMTTLNLLR